MPIQKPAPPLNRFLVLKVGFLVLTLVIAFASIMLIPAFSNVANRNLTESEKLKRVLEWGNLDPLPKDLRDFKISTSGGMFSRSYRVNFTAPRQSIEKWLHNPPSDKLAKDIPTTRRYEMTPGGGANSASVTVDYSLGDGRIGRVDIYVSWS
jgi:hypothetical protein